jgi:hypothetical protein
VLLVASKRIASLRVVKSHIANRQSNARALLTRKFIQGLVYTKNRPDDKRSDVAFGSDCEVFMLQSEVLWVECETETDFAYAIGFE